MTGDTRGLRQGKKKWHFQKTSLLRRILDAQEPAAITRRIDWAITAVACVVLLCLHIALYRHSGAFWRDEACTLYVAKAPSWETMWSWMGKDSAPALMFGSVRLWIAAGPGATDEGLRLLGTLVSLGVMASLFVSCWMFTARVPLVGTALVLFSGAVFYYGSSLRLWPGYPVDHALLRGFLEGVSAAEPWERPCQPDFGGAGGPYQLSELLSVAGNWAGGGERLRCLPIMETQHPRVDDLFHRGAFDVGVSADNPARIAMRRTSNASTWGCRWSGANWPARFRWAARSCRTPGLSWLRRRRFVCSSRSLVTFAGAPLPARPRAYRCTWRW